MKRTVAALTGLAFIACCGLAAAQTPPAPSAAASNGKVGVVNINKVLKSFNKANAYNTWLMNRAKFYGDQANALQAQVNVRQADAQKEADPKKKDIIAEEIRGLVRRVEDLNAAAQKDLDANRGPIMVQIYNDISQITASVARSSGVDVVLAYPDVTDPAEGQQPQKIFAKLFAGAAMPLYVAPGADMTDAILTTLNQSCPVPPELKAELEKAGVSATPPAGGTPPVAPPAAPNK